MKTLLAILAVIPSLIEVIAAVEKIFPESGVGTEKLSLIKTIMAEAYAGISEIWKPLENIIAAVVAFANKIGAFTSTSTK